MTQVENLSEASFTESTVRRMYQLADAAKVTVEFQDLIHDIVKSKLRGQWRNYRGELAAVFNWVKQNVDYRRDPHDVEVLQDPIVTLNREHGDCDDMSILLCAAFEVMGAPSRFVTVSTRPDGSPSHIYVEAFVDNRWTSADASVKYSSFGWTPRQGVTNKRVWSRHDVGLAGYEEKPQVAGVGMFEEDDDIFSSGFQYNVGKSKDHEGGFSSGFKVVKPNGIPNDISRTFAPGLPGEEVSPNRIVRNDPISPDSDQRATWRRGDPTIPYPQTFPVSPTQDPPEDQIVRGQLPMEFDPNVWTGQAPVWQSDPMYMIPGGGMHGMGAYFSAEDMRGFKERAMTRLAEYMTQYGLTPNVSGFGDLGSLATDAQNLLKGVYDAALGTGTVTTQDIIFASIDVGADVYAAKLAEQAKQQAASQTQVITTPTVKPPSGGLPSWAIPVGIGILVLGVGYAMSRR